MSCWKYHITFCSFFPSVSCLRHAIYLITRREDLLCTYYFCNTGLGAMKDTSKKYREKNQDPIISSGWLIQNRLGEYNCLQLYLTPWSYEWEEWEVFLSLSGSSCPFWIYFHFNFLKLNIVDIKCYMIFTCHIYFYFLISFYIFKKNYWLIFGERGGEEIWICCSIYLHLCTLIRDQTYNVGESGWRWNQLTYPAGGPLVCLSF